MLLGPQSVAAASLWLTGAVRYSASWKLSLWMRNKSGAGAAGLSAAYYLRTFVEENGVAVNITVFEKTDRIGGRTLTINPFGNSLQRVELGVSIFIKKNPKGIAVTT